MNIRKAFMPRLILMWLLAIFIALQWASVFSDMITVTTSITQDCVGDQQQQYDEPLSSDATAQHVSSSTVSLPPCRKRSYHYKENPFYLARETSLAHSLLDNRCGIEIGPSACNPFNLNTIQVGLTDSMNKEEFDYYKHLQLRDCGDYAKVDFAFDAANLHIFPNSSMDFVLHSHVWEHLPNPLKALEEWVRVVRHGGIIFVIVPHRCASPLDCQRDITTMDELLYYYEADTTMDDFQASYDAYNGHLIVFDYELLLQIMMWFNHKHMETTHMNLMLSTFLITDDKVGNGIHISWMVIKDEKRLLNQTYLGKFTL